jgi:hypothetical protein
MTDLRAPTNHCGNARKPTHEDFRARNLALHLGLGSSRRVSDQSRITLVPGATGTFSKSWV